MPHGRHIKKYSTDMSMVKMYSFLSDQHALHQWKFVLNCCDKCAGIFIPGQESNSNDANTCPTISFISYSVLSQCTMHVRRPYE